MANEMKVYVLELLENYHKRAREIALLRYELAHPVRVTEDELIEAMSYAHQDGVGRPEGHISNKTLYIALNYREQAGRLNTENVGEISAKLTRLEREQARLEYYISLLEPRQEQVLRRLYLERMPREKAADEFGLSVRRLQEIRVQAIEGLAEMYCFTDALY